MGVHHPKWEERPILILERSPGSTVTAGEVLAHLASRIVKWWMPDAVIFDDIPLTATGKTDKKALRERFWDHLRENSANQ